MFNDWPPLGTSDGRLKIVSIAVIAVLVVSLAASTVLFGMSGVTAKPTVAVDGLDISNPDPVTTDNVTTVGVSYTTGSVSWSNSPEPVEKITYTWYVTGPDGEKEKTHDWTCESAVDPSPAECEFENTTDGSAPFETSFSILGSSSWEGEDFVPPAGETKETQFELIFEAELFWDGGSTSKTVSDTVVVTVTNPQETGGTSTSDGTETSAEDVEIAIDLSSSVHVAGD